MFYDVPGMLRRMKTSAWPENLRMDQLLHWPEIPPFQEAMEKGYLLKRPNGDVAMGYGRRAWAWWTSPIPAPGSGTRVSCRRCWTRRGLLQGRFRRADPNRRGVLRRQRPEPMHNYYTYLYSKCVLSCWKSTGQKPGLPVCPQRHRGRPEIPRTLGRRLPSNYLSMSEVPAGAVYPCVCRASALEP